ncbi:hypothetical protein [Salisaeta longa]|uniref:hypothetical protein n=1 Tax=Salisaeta longa TaxID=503170 RepID=UPI0003B69D66|nr:hypothetical protein [Salisaeta longa]
MRIAFLHALLAIVLATGGCAPAAMGQRSGAPARATPRGLSVRPALTPAADRWWARDKAKHVAFSTLWTLSTQYVLVQKAHWTRGDALPLSVGTAGAVGVAKEVYDWRWGTTRHFSRRDLVADAVGIALGVGIILL